MTHTDDQRTVMLQLADPHLDADTVKLDVLRQLIDLRLMFKTSDGSLDLTDEGERVLRQLHDGDGGKPV
jgi:hypothetical protein